MDDSSNEVFVNEMEVVTGQVIRGIEKKDMTAWNCCDIEEEKKKDITAQDSCVIEVENKKMSIPVSRQ